MSTRQKLPLQYITTNFAGGRVCAEVAFLLFFTTSLFYQYCVLIGLLYPTLGGYFTFGALTAAPFAAMSFLVQRKHLKFWQRRIGAGYVVFVFVFAVAIINGIISGAEPLNLESHYYALIRLVSVFLIALTISSGARWVRVASTSTLLLFFFAVLSFSTWDLSETFIDVDNSVGFFKINYEAVSAVLVMIIIFILPIKCIFVRFIFYTVCLIIIFILGARFEFASCFLVIFIAECAKSKNRPMFIGLSIVFVLFAFMFLTFLSMDSYGHRVSRLLDIANDPSFIERNALTLDAIDTLVKSPIFGSYSSYAPGYFSHNILSAWVDFGFPGFLLFVYIGFGPLLFLLARFKSESGNFLFVQALCATSVMSFALIFAKDYTYIFLPFAIGVFCRYESLRLRFGRRLGPAPEIRTEQ